MITTIIIISILIQSSPKLASSNRR